MSKKVCGECGADCRWLEDQRYPSATKRWVLVDARTASDADKAFSADAGHIQHKNTCPARSRKQPNKKVTRK